MFWPDNARIAVTTSLMFEAGSQDQQRTFGPIPVAQEGDFPDLPTNSWFDYAANEGIPRALELFDRHGVKASGSGASVPVELPLRRGRRRQAGDVRIRCPRAGRAWRWVSLEPNAKDAARGVQIRNVAETFRPMTSVPIIVNTGFDKAKANEVLSKGHANLVAFGVPFIADPDLVERLRSNAPPNKPDPTTFYGIGPKGYTDYPMLADAVAA